MSTSATLWFGAVTTVLTSSSLLAAIEITEICPRPDALDPNDKEAGWIELTNTGTEVDNLSNYALIRWNRGKEDKKKNRRILCDRELQPGERTLVYTSEAYPNYWDGEKVAVYDNDVMVFPSKVNPKKFPNVALYKSDQKTLLQTFIVPVDLPDNQSFGPGKRVITRTIIDEQTPYSYTIGDGETQSGQGRLTIATMQPPTNVTEGQVTMATIAVDTAVTSASIADTLDTAGILQTSAYDFAGMTGGNKGIRLTPDTYPEADYTVSLWFRSQPTNETVTSDTSGRGMPLFESRPSKTTNRTGILVFLNDDNQITIQPRTTNDSAQYLSNTTANYADNQWHHLVLVAGQKAGDALTLYIDGKAELSAEMPFDCALQTTIPYCFGHAYDSTSWHTFYGQLADIRVFNRGLSATEVGYLADENAALRNVTTQYGGLATRTNDTTGKYLSYNEDTDTYTFNAGDYTSNGAYIENAYQATDTLTSAGETLAFWVKPTSFDATGKEAITLMDSRDGSQGNDGYLLLVGTNEDDKKHQVYIQRGGGTKVNVPFANQKALPLDDWTHIAFAIDATSQEGTLYINGVAVDSQTITGYTPAMTTRRFGGSHDNYWRGFRGEMADIQIYSGVLPAREVVKCYNRSAETRGKALKTENGLEGTTTVETLQTVTGSATVALPSYSGDAEIVFHAPETVGTLTLTMNGTTVSPETSVTLPEGIDTMQVAWTLEPSQSATTMSAVLGATLSTTASSITRAIMPTLTPGEANIYTDAIAYGPNIGPTNQEVFEDFGYYLPDPTATPGEDYTVVLDVHPIADDDENTLAKVELMYRCNFGEVKYVSMTHTDGVFLRVVEEEDEAGETIEVEKTFPAYVGVIPAADLPEAGKLIQFGARITDGAARQWISPSRNNPDDCPNWFGTIVTPNAETQMAKHEKLQTFHLFVEDKANLELMDKDYDAIKGAHPLGARCGIYDSQTDTYYDNVRIDLRGNTSAGFPKKSHGLRFSKCQPLTCKNMLEGKKGTKLKEIRKTSFTAEYADPTFIRQSLSFHVWRNAGNLVPFHYPVRLNLNGEFYQLAFHSNRFTDELIEDYYGLDPMGYGYKNVGAISPNVGTTAGSVEKKTPDDGDETSTAAYAPLVAWATTFSQSASCPENDAELTQVVYDSFDIPAWINYLATARITQECDDIWANICLYWDKNGNDVWMPLAYDHNLSFGAWYYGDDSATGRIGLRPDSDNFKSHPLYSGWKIRAHTSNGSTVGSGNYAVEALWQNSDFRAMYLRRLRTLMDEHLKAPGTSQEDTPFWDYVTLFKEVTAADAELDRAKWGTSYANTVIYVWDHILEWDEAFEDMWDNYVEPRRNHLYNTHSITNDTWEIGYAFNKNAGIPLAHPTAFAPIVMERVTGGVKLTNPNTEAIDLSGWTVEGLMDVTTLPEDSEDLFTLPSGTVLLGGKSLVLAYDRKQYVAQNEPGFVIGLAVYGDDKTWIPEPNTTASAITLKKADGTVAVDNLLPAAVAEWLSNAIATGRFTAGDLQSVTAAADYLMAYTLDAEPYTAIAEETELTITAFTIDASGNIILTVTLAMGDTLKEGSINGSITLLATDSLTAETWEDVSDTTQPQTFASGQLSLAPKSDTSPRFFKARITAPFEN